VPLHCVEENKKFSTLLEEDEKDDSKPQLNLKSETLNTINQFENKEEDSSETSSCVINLGAPAIKDLVNMHNQIAPYTPSPHQKNSSSPH
jgi:hypothetical protein